MRATIYFETIEQYDAIREMADMDGISSHPVHNMKEMRKFLYDKPKLIIESRPSMARPFIEKMQQMGYRVEVERFSVI